MLAILVPVGAGYADVVEFEEAFDIAPSGVAISSMEEVFRVSPRGSAFAIPIEVKKKEFELWRTEHRSKTALYYTAEQPCYPP